MERIDGTGRFVYIIDCDHKEFDSEIRVFEAAGAGYKMLRCATQDEAIAQCGDARVMINQYLKLDIRFFKAIPSLGCVVRYGVGVDNINLADATECGVRICNVPDYGVNEVADHALALMLALQRKIVVANDSVKKGVWDYTLTIPVRRHRDLTVGVIGVGRIGAAFAERVRALGCRVVGYDNEYGNPGRAFPDFIEYVSFEQLLAESDVVSVHCLLTESSAKMINGGALARMKKTAFLVNTARGGLIDEDALAAALEGGAIAGAAIDVVAKEPLAAGSRLAALDNCIITPHMAWYSVESSADLKRMVAEEAVRFLDGVPLRSQVNKI
jgi:D-3-phosphoglycerate dehydrogenase